MAISHGLFTGAKQLAMVLSELLNLCIWLAVIDVVEWGFTAVFDGMVQGSIAVLIVSRPFLHLAVR